MKTILKTIAILSLSLLTMAGCYNDDLVWQELEKHEQRISKLEDMCQKFNWDIYEMQNLIKAIKARDYLISVTSTQSQYVLLFAEAGKIIINKHLDSNEPEVSVPAIGVKQDSDGNWYWTLSGEWLTDQNGERIRANGTDGQDGNKGLDAITPEFKIKDGYWMISYDDGKTWELIGDATGENGKDGDSFFKDVKVTDADVTLILADGTSVVIPRKNTNATLVDIIFSDMGVGMTPGSTRQVNFTLTNADENTLVKAVAQNGWRVKVTMTSVSEGYLTVTAPDPMEEDEIIVFVYDGNGKTIMKTINFVTGVISVALETKALSGRAGEFSATVNTNLDVEIEVPSEAGSWLTCQAVPTKAINTLTYTFSITDNFTESIRTAVIEVKDKNSTWSEKINVTQAVHDYLDFEDPKFHAYLIEEFDANNDKEINKSEAPLIKEIKAENRGIESLEGIASLDSLKSLDVSGNSLTDVNLSADQFWNIKTVDCADNDITNLDVSGCAFFLDKLDVTGNDNMTLTLLDKQGAKEFNCSTRPTIQYVPDNYESTDFSRDKNYVILQKHTVGEGIPVVFMGDAYTDRDIKTGLYDYRMRMAMEHLFSEEPYTTFRDRFDVYYLEMTSKSRKLDGESTVFKTQFINREYYDKLEVNSKIKTLAKQLTGNLTGKYTAFPCVLINASPVTNRSATKINVAAWCIAVDNNITKSTHDKLTIIHELGGHLLGKLGDEYVEFTEAYTGTSSQYENLSTTNDPSLVPWTKFFELEAYKNDVGIYEGGGTYATGIWRSSKHSVMECSTEQFNAVCRHLIYKRIMELSGKEYSWEAFLEYDKKNLANSPK